MRRRHAARELHAQIERGRERSVEEILDPFSAEHIGDLMGIADSRRHAMTEHATIEFERCDQRRFDMEMRVDEAGDDDLARNVESPRAAVIALRSDNAIAANGDVAFDKLASDEVENPTAFEYDIRLSEAPALLDGA